MSSESLPLDFDIYLKETLINLKTDDEIFSPYIKGILEGDESPEDKNEALQGIISEITDSGIEAICEDILKKWSSCSGKNSCNCESQPSLSPASLDIQLAKLMEKQASCIATSLPPIKKPISREQEQLKQAVLAQHAQVSAVCDDGEEEEVEETRSDGLLAKNTNAAAVEQEMRQKREQRKLEHQVKKDKDKAER
ncbi:hypothetical protein HAZT_HAZT000830 [Hyalella azteca]|nr:hypothetical protein HAZT_HAZT000830 [Hyalella azteca]